MNRKFQRSLGGVLILASLLLSACGAAAPAPTTETQAETTVPETTAVPQEETVTVPQEETEAPDEDNGLYMGYTSDNTPIYLVDLSVYKEPGYNPLNALSIPAAIDIYGGGLDTSMACMIFKKPIRNCAYFRVPFQIMYDDDRDNSDVGWQSVFLKKDLEHAIQEDFGFYFVPDPAYTTLGKDVFYLDEENSGYIDFGSFEPVDLCGITAVPTVAPNGWSPFYFSITTHTAIVGFLTEEDRQVFLDDLAQ